MALVACGARASGSRPCATAGGWRQPAGPSLPLAVAITSPCSRLRSTVDAFHEPSIAAATLDDEETSRTRLGSVAPNATSSTLQVPLVTAAAAATIAAARRRPRRATIAIARKAAIVDGVSAAAVGTDPSPKDVVGAGDLSELRARVAELEREVEALRHQIQDVRGELANSRESQMVATSLVGEFLRASPEAPSSTASTASAPMSAVTASKGAGSTIDGGAHEHATEDLTRGQAEVEAAIQRNQQESATRQADSSRHFEAARAAIDRAGAAAAAAQRRVPASARVFAAKSKHADGEVADGAEAEVVYPAGHFWKLPPRRYEFKEERRLEILAWPGAVEQAGKVEKPGKMRTCQFYRVVNAVDPSVVSRILEHCERSTSYVMEPDSVDRIPTFEYYPFQNGEWQDEGMRALLQPAIDERILPYVRARYGAPTCAIADILVRRYLPGERRTHAVHFDGHAFVTAVLGLSDPDTYDGGLYLQPEPGVASRLFFRIEPGDLVLHSFDLQHGVHVWRGVRYSLVFWVKDTMQAVREHTTPWYDRLVESGDADALYALALNHANGASGKPLDVVKAIELYERSAHAGHHFAQNNLGQLYKRAHKVIGLESGLEKSVAWLKTAAEAGFALAQKNLALAFAAGEGVEKNEAEAVAWMRRAAEQLDVEAAYMLGEMLRQGRGVTKDMAEAFIWLQRSAKAGFPKAQYAFGALYMEGHGVEKDARKAEAWFKYAAAQGVPEAKNNIAALSARRGEIGDAAKIWAELAKGGEPNAQCNLGMCYMRGVGKERDSSKAREWLEKAAAQGHEMAMHALMQL